MQQFLDLADLKLLDGPKDARGKPLKGGRIAARKYSLPEKIGSIWLSPAWTRDHSRSLWEPLAWSPSALDHVCEGIGLERDPNEPKALPYREALETGQAVLVTQPNRGAVLPVEIEGEREVFLLWASDVERVHPFILEEGEDE